MITLNDKIAALLDQFKEGEVICSYDTINFLMTVTVNRPEKMNALNSAVLKKIDEIFRGIKKIPLTFCRGVLFTGMGEKAFIAGADIAELSTLSRIQAQALSRLGHDATEAIETCGRPVIACLNGHAMGGGLEFALACDAILMLEKSLVAMPEVKLGLIPGFGGTQRLARLIGQTFAKDMIYSGRVVKAQEAFDMKLAWKVFKTNIEMHNFAIETLKLWSQNSLSAIQIAKKCMNYGRSFSFEESLICEADAFADLFETPDMKEGTQAFIDKRIARFSN